MHPRHLLALVLAFAGSARAAGSLNVVTAVEVKDEGSSVVLQVTGSKPPNFTTFSMADPPRFVIDLSEARFQGVPEDVVVRDGVVNLVKNLSYGSDATSIARIMVAFQLDVDPPGVQAVGNALVVRIAKPAGAAAAVAADDGAKARAAEQKAQDEAARAAAEARAREEAAARAAADEKARDEAARAAEAQARADAERAEVAKAEAAAAEEKARAEANAQSAAEAQAAYEKERQEAVAREAEAARAQARAEAEQKARDEADARATAEREHAAATSRTAQVAEAPAPEREPAASEASSLATPAVAEASAGGLDVGAPRAQLREIGFRQLPGASRVFVRTSVTPRFTIQDVGENVIRVELENTRATRRNDLRHLDTSFFPSAVAVVTPARRGASYVLDIKLRERVPYQQRIEGDMLAIDFERPASPGSLPMAGPADETPDGAGAERVPAALEGDGASPAAN